MKSTFSTLDIVKILDIPRERLREWISRGYVKATVPAEGQGTKALFEVADIYLIGLFRSLIEHGLKRDVAADFIHRMFYLNPKSKSFANKASCFIVRQIKDPKSGEIKVQTISSPERLGVYRMFDSLKGTFYIYIDNFDGTGHFITDYEDRDVRVCEFDPNENWTSVLIINFFSIRVQVDLALEEFS